MVGFVGARPMTERDLYAQQRADAMNQAFYARNQYAADQRMQGRQAEAELQARQAIQAQALQAAAQQQASQQAFLAQQAQNARDDEYSQANDPMQRQSRERSLDMAAQRQANLIGAQSSANINQNYENMLDQRALALNKGMIDSALTMQRGNIDSRLLTQQGQQGLIAAGANHGYKVDDDLRQKEMQIEERNGQMLQTHDYNDQDKPVVAGIRDQIQALKTKYYSNDKDKPSDGQYRAVLSTLLGQLSAYSPSQRRITPQMQFDQERVRDENGVSWLRDQKGVPHPLVVKEAAAGKAPLTPEQIKTQRFDALHKRAIEIQKAGGIVNDGDSGNSPKISRQQAMQQALEEEAAFNRGESFVGKESPSQTEQPVATQAAPQEVPLMDLQRAEEILSKYGNAPANGPGQAAAVDWARKVMWAAKQGLQQQDPRMQAVQQAPQQQMPGRQPMAPPQQMQPGVSGPAVDPRVMQLRQVQQAPFPPENTPAPANDQQQTQGALQTFKAIVQKFGGMPPAGSQEERIAMQAAAFLKQRGIDPTGDARRSAAPTLPGFSRPSPSSRNLAE